MLNRATISKGTIRNNGVPHLECSIIPSSHIKEFQTISLFVIPLIDEANDSFYLRDVNERTLGSRL